MCFLTLRNINLRLESGSRGQTREKDEYKTPVGQK